MMLQRVGNDVLRQHSACRGTAVECGARISDAVDVCLEALIKAGERDALQVVTQVADQIAGALAYCDMVGGRTATIEPPTRGGNIGTTTFSGAVPWDDDVHGQGFKGGMGAVDVCTHDIGHNRLGESQLQTIGEELYQTNFRFLRQEEGVSLYEGILMVPGAPALGKVGTGEDRYQARLTELKDRLRAAEAQLQHEVKLRAA